MTTMPTALLTSEPVARAFRRTQFGPMILLLAVGMTAGCAADAVEESTQDEAELVGGQRDLRWNASGYLVKEGAQGKVACGATLIARRLAVTAAHCVGEEGARYAFGAGDVGGPVVRVLEREVHPNYHPEPEGRFDLVHALRKYDVAVLYLERDVDFATPATLPDDKPGIGCNIQAIGYRDGIRKSTPACVMFRLTLGSDPIFEVHPAERSALCVADGDEGSAVVARDEGRTTLVGFYVGSITQGFTDCRRGTQFLNGYESAYGYKDFFHAAIARSLVAR